jgi:TolB protein
VFAAGLLFTCSAETAGVYGSASDGVVFIRVVAGSNEVFRARLSDGAVRALTRTADREESWPYWSERGRRLVFQAVPTGEGGTSDLILWDPETGRETPLANTPHREERWPSWSPDGKRLAYAFRAGQPAAGVPIADLEKGTTTIVARSGPKDFFFRPTFDPASERLVAQRRAPVGRGSKLWILALDAAPRPLTRDPAWFDQKAWFTRDGSRIVYSRGPTAGGRLEVVTVADDGSGLRTAVSTDHSDNHSARPSSIRDEMVLVSNRDESSDIFVADLSGDRVRNLTRSPERDELAPHWSPDGNLLVATAGPIGGGRPGRVDKRVVVLDRGGRVLLDTPGFMPDWMPPWP